MKKSLKTSLFIILLLFVCATMTFAGLGLVSANADGLITFEMVEGASVKNGGQKDSGMSFVAKVTKGAEVNGKIKFVIAPKNYVAINDFTEENLFGESAKYYFDDNVVDGTLKDGKLEIWNLSGSYVKSDEQFDYYRASIVDFGQESLSDGEYTETLLREYVGRAYIENDTEYVFAKYNKEDKANNTRSMALVAQLAIICEDEAITDIDAFSNIYLTDGIKNTVTKVTTEFYKNSVKQEELTVIDSEKKISESVSLIPDANKFNGYELDENNVTNGVALANDKLIFKINYTPIEYAINYAGVEGATNLNAVNSYNIETETFALNDATKDDNTFVGWYNGTTFVSEITKGSFGEITLNAVLVPEVLDTTIYTVSEHGGVNYDNSYEFNFMGLESVSSSGKLSSSGKTVTGVTYGAESATLNFVGDKTANIVVNIERPVWNVGEIELFDATKGVGFNGVKTGVSEVATEFDIATKFGSIDLSTLDVTATSDDENPIVTNDVTYVDGKLMGVPVNGQKKTKQTVSFLNDAVEYAVTLTPYTNVITSADEFVSVFTGGTADNPKVNSGYYTLGNDILTGYKVVKHNDTSGTYYDTMSGTFDGNGRKIQRLNCQNGGLFGILTGKVKNVLLDLYLDGMGNYRYVPLGSFTTTTELSDIYFVIGTFGNKTTSSNNIYGFASSGMSGAVKMSNIIFDSTGLKFAPSDGDENKWEKYNPYHQNYDIASTNTSRVKNLQRLQENQKNVYFITEQYLANYSLGPNKPHAIIDAGNKEEGWTYESKYTGGVEESKIETIFIDTFYRYNTANAMADATKVGQASDYTSFTETGLWTWDTTNGLAWKGNA